VSVYLGRPLIRQNAQQLINEADLRYSLVRLRENAEARVISDPLVSSADLTCALAQAIAFYRGEAQEASEVKRRLGRVVDNFRTLVTTQRNLEFFTTGYRYLIQILPILVVAPLYFAGSIELGVVTQSSSAFNHVLSDLSILITEFEVDPRRDWPR